MNYLLVLLLLVVAILVTYFVTKKLTFKKGWNKGYEHGELSQQAKYNEHGAIFVEGSVTAKGINPFNGIEIIDKDFVPYFGIDIKFDKNDKEKPNTREFTIKRINSLYPKQDDIHITPIGVSDGYHTFDELYYYRLCYNAIFINSLVKLINENPAKFKDIKVCKSKKHFGGEPCYGGDWFIVMISTPWGQISNHYKLEYWDMFDCRATNTSWKWDGHDMKEAMERLNRLSKFIATGSDI